MLSRPHNRYLLSPSLPPLNSSFFLTCKAFCDSSKLLPDLSPPILIHFHLTSRPHCFTFLLSFFLLVFFLLFFSVLSFFFSLFFLSLFYFYAFLFFLPFILFTSSIFLSFKIFHLFFFNHSDFQFCSFPSFSAFLCLFHFITSHFSIFLFAPLLIFFYPLPPSPSSSPFSFPSLSSSTPTLFSFFLSLFNVSFFLVIICEDTLCLFFFIPSYSFSLYFHLPIFSSSFYLHVSSSFSLLHRFIFLFLFKFSLFLNFLHLLIFLFSLLFYSVIHFPPLHLFIFLVYIFLILFSLLHFNFFLSFFI
ncbi:unnamed protein product [Acanthosepion pharaonis]|uniref:Uncharacterized protein n=1 Tax=Acanthosepion pharaonis TaxID=158019 RepID=A0A812AQ63_ACAPH|nr:unnamed protein product [Sepia pharaonis]